MSLFDQKIDPSDRLLSRTAGDWCHPLLNEAVRNPADLDTILSVGFYSRWRSRSAHPFRWCKVVSERSHAALLVLILRPLYFMDLPDNHDAKAGLLDRLGEDKIEHLYRITARTPPADRHKLLGFISVGRMYAAFAALRSQGRFPELPRRAKWIATEEDRLLSIQLHSEGLYLQPIASRLGISPRTLAPWMERWGLDYSDVRGSRNQQIFSRRIAGDTLEMLSEDFGLSVGYLSLLCRDIKQEDVPLPLQIKAALAKTNIPSGKLDEAVQMLMFFLGKDTPPEQDNPTTGQEND